jgi:hypothetical protein
MSAIDTTNQTPVQGNAATVASLRTTKVSMVVSWSVIPTASNPAKKPFDPAAAGRRAVAKHGEALRRLSY